MVIHQDSTPLRNVVEEVRALVRTQDISEEVVEERMRAYKELGYDLGHDIEMGGWQHPADQAYKILDYLMGSVVQCDKREMLIEAAGCLVAAVDALDYEEGRVGID